MNKILALLLSLILLLSAAGCSGQKEADSSKSDPESQTEQSNSQTNDNKETEKVQMLLNTKPENSDITTEMLKKSLISAGNLSRLKKVMGKAEKGEEITIGFIGGSITEGMSASSKATNYTQIVTNWWKNSFPNCKINYVNAGIGSTGSLIGVHRMDEDLLSKKPDFVIVEFACNDEKNALTDESYEGVVRRILDLENNPAVMLLFMTKQDGTSNHNPEIEIGRKYNVPMLSYRDAVMTGIENNQIKWQDVSPDAVHPNDKGHKIAADLIIHRLTFVNNNMNKIIDKEEPLPKTENRFLNARLLTNKTFTPKSWGAFKTENNAYPNLSLSYGFSATEKNNPIVFETEAKVVTILYKMMVLKRGAKAEVRVDGLLVATLDSDFLNGFGEYANMKTVLDRKQSKKSTVEIRIVSNGGDDPAGKFLILGIMEAK